MPRLRTNIIANFLGKGWLALMSLAFIPVYISFMGIEAYGLVGFYLSLNAILAFMEFGMGVTMNRETARLTGRDWAGQEYVCDLLRSYEWVAWTSCLVLSVLFYVFAPFVGDTWIRQTSLGRDEVATAIAMMGLCVALRLPFSVYSGGLCGLQRQISYNAVLGIFALLRSGGVIIVMLWYSPTITAFFMWNVVVELAQSVVGGFILWHAISKEGYSPRFRLDSIRTVWRFSAGMALLSILTAVSTQMDKFVVSRELTLEMLGYYSVAVAIVSGLYYMAYPINTAVFPRFSELIQQDDYDGLVQALHRFTRLTVAIVTAGSAFICFFGGDVLRVWTNDPNIVTQIEQPLSIMAVGTGWGLSLLIPIAVIYSYGRVRPQLLASAVGVGMLAVWLPYSIQTWGLSGAATSSVLTAVVFWVVYIPAIRQHIAWEQLARWFYLSVLPLTIVGYFSGWVIFSLLDISDQGYIAGLELVGVVVFIGFIQYCALLILELISQKVLSQKVVIKIRDS